MRADLEGTGIRHRAEVLRVELVRARGELGLTQVELGRMAGVMSRTICNYENAHMPLFRTDALIKLADALGIDLDDFGYLPPAQRSATGSYKTLPRVHTKTRRRFAHREFGRQMREARLLKVLTQEALSAMMDVAPTTIVDYERGKYIPSTKNLIRWCRALGLDEQTWIEARLKEKSE